VTEPEELVRRVLDAHNRGADVLRDGKVVRGEAFRSGRDALEAAGA
jgi:hypothetical protein